MPTCRSSRGWRSPEPCSWSPRTWWPTSCTRGWTRACERRRAALRGRSEGGGDGAAALAVALVGVDRLALLQAQGDVVEAVEQAVPDVGADGETGGDAPPTDLLLGEVELSPYGLRGRAAVLHGKVDGEPAGPGAA